MTIRIRYRILNARLAVGAVSGTGVDQAFDGFDFAAQPSLNKALFWN
ncbi:MAG: hypothetical protein ACRECZ_01050 [Methylocella sp.]